MCDGVNLLLKPSSETQVLKSSLLYFKKGGISIVSFCFLCKRKHCLFFFFPLSSPQLVLALHSQINLCQVGFHGSVGTKQQWLPSSAILLKIILRIIQFKVPFCKTITISRKGLIAHYDFFLVLPGSEIKQQKAGIGNKAERVKQRQEKWRHAKWPT